MTTAPAISAVFPPKTRMIHPEMGANNTIASPDGTMHKPALITLNSKP